MIEEIPLLKMIQSRAARIAVGPSTVRGRGNKGVVAAARDHLCRLDLAPFGTSKPGAFAAALDQETEALRRALPRSAQHWGVARKVLNIFLRDAFYASHLSEAYGLTRAERHYELPLDSITARHLRRAIGRGVLPTWRGVRYVTPDLNAHYQRAATQVAAGRGIARVHLDALWWSVSRDGLHAAQHIVPADKQRVS